MPILCYEITGEAKPNPRSTTGALDGQLSAVLKQDHEAAKTQVYSELVANRLAMFLGLPVIMGVPAKASSTDSTLHFAALRAAEAGLNVYDFTADDRTDPDMDSEDSEPLPEGVFRNAGHVRQTKQLCERYPREAAGIAVFDLWIGNEDRALNFKAELSGTERGVIFALDQGSSLLSCRPTVVGSLEALSSDRFPSFHPFQRLLSPVYCRSWVEQISEIPANAVLAATTYGDTVGNVTLDEQFAAWEKLMHRKELLEGLVHRVLL